MKDFRRRFSRRDPPTSKNRTNHEIKASKVRLVSENESRVVLIEEALQKARELDQDLVEITRNEEIPIVKIIDYGRFKFNKAKKEKENRKRQKTTQVKEIKMGPKIDSHDFERKCLTARNFLESGDTVKIGIRFRGREMAHTELGLEKMIEFQKHMEKFGLLEKAPKLEGRIMTMVIKAKKK